METYMQTDPDNILYDAKILEGLSISQGSLVHQRLVCIHLEKTS